MPQNPILKAHLEGVEKIENVGWYALPAYVTKVIGYDKDGKAYVGKAENLESFLTTYAEMILNAAKEAGPKEEVIGPITNRTISEKIGYNSCLSSFRSSIDEGIKEIKKWA